jgi:putative transposase
MSFWRLYYHAVWATKERVPVITDEIVEPIQHAIRRTSADLDVNVFAIGVLPDHIHVFAQIPPALVVAKVIGRWKGASSHAANEHRPGSLSKVGWQEGYGVLTVSQSGFDHAVAYVLNQRERHAAREVYGPLERTGDELIGRNSI